MHHDAVPLDLAGPTSARNSDVRDFYADFTRRGLEAMSEKIGKDARYESNATGHLAWDVSLLIRAACLTWRVTGDSTHLEQAVAWSRHLIEHTDAAIALKDWRGQCGPTWSAGARYTAGRAMVGSAGGLPIYLQAAADRVIIDRPGPTTAIIRVIREDGTVWSSPEASLLPYSEDYLPDVLARRSTSSAVLVRGLPGPVDLTSVVAAEHILGRQFAAHLVHTGMIARSLIGAAQALAVAGPSTVDTDLTPADLISAAERSLFTHDDDIRIRQGRAWFVTPEDFPGRRLGLELPHNHVVDAATSYLILGRLRGDDALSGLGRSLARRFLEEIEAYESGTIRHPWHYYPVDSDTCAGVTRSAPIAERHVRAVPRAEDSSHATIRVRGLGEWKAIDDELLPGHVLTAIALSFRRHFVTKRNNMITLRWLPEDEHDEARLGHADTYVGSWGALAPWDSTLRRRINSIAYRHPPTAVFGATVLSSAEIVALDEGVPIGASVTQRAPRWA